MQIYMAFGLFVVFGYSR